jgi:hypothetical protein
MTVGEWGRSSIVGKIALHGILWKEQGVFAKIETAKGGRWNTPA